jgi:hypothetical protein
MSDRSRVMTQTKRDTLVLQVGGMAWGKQPHTVKNLLLRKSNKGESWIDLMMMEGVGDRWEKMEGSCSRGQKPTVGCSASGRRRSIYMFRAGLLLIIRRINSESCQLPVSIAHDIYQMLFIHS